LRIVLGEKVKAVPIEERVGLPWRARHRPCGLVMAGFLAPVTALLARQNLYRKKLSNSAYVPRVISHNKGAARFAHFGKNAVSPFYGDSVTLFPFAASTETGKARKFNVVPL
jgi:hypothetical protein